MTTHPIKKFLLGAGLLSLLSTLPVAASTVIPPGVPEPGLVLWGLVVNQTNVSQTLPIQTAQWSVTDGDKTAVFNAASRPAVRILSLDGQSFYVLEVPFDTRRLGQVTLSDPATVGLDSFELKASSPPTYVLTPTINGALATVRSVNGAPSSGESLPVAGFSSLTRGRVLRVDLAILPAADDYEAWAAGFFGDPNLPEAARDADPDGDGLTNEEEFAAGTDPTDPESVLRLLTLTFDPAGQDATLEWQSVAGKQYMIQSATNANGPWADVGSAVAGSAEATQTQIGVAPGTPRSFFRVRLVP